MESDLQRIKLLGNKTGQKKGHLPLRNPVTDLIFVKKKLKVVKWFEIGLNQRKALPFHILLFISTFLQNITQQVREFSQ